MDWQRGKIPFFVPPPGFSDKGETNITDLEEDENTKVKIIIIYIARY